MKCPLLIYIVHIFLNYSDESWWSDHDMQNSQVMLQLVQILEKKK
jgi:triacylglycerol esterase/lipase EstA (alpha/beta hydrolase family)